MPAEIEWRNDDGGEQEYADRNQSNQRKGPTSELRNGKAPQSRRDARFPSTQLVRFAHRRSLRNLGDSASSPTGAWRVSAGMAQCRLSGMLAIKDRNSFARSKGWSQDHECRLAL